VTLKVILSTEQLTGMKV